MKTTLTFLLLAFSFPVFGVGNVQVDTNGVITYPLNFATANGLGSGGGGSGEANTASNLGTGWRMFSIKSGVDLRFNTLTNDVYLSIGSNNNVFTFGLGTQLKTDINATSNSVVSLGTSKQDHTSNLDGWSAIATSVKQNALGFTPLNPASNLSELVSALTSRANLGLAIGSNVEAWSANLDSWSGLATSAKQNALGFIPVNIAGDTMTGSLLVTSLTNSSLTASVMVGTDANKKEVSSTLTVTEANALHGITPLTSANIDDTAYSSSENGVTTKAISANALYDYLHLFDTDDNGKVNVLDLGAGIVKTSAGGVVSTATSGTDYAPATSGSSVLKGNGAGGTSTATEGTDYLGSARIDNTPYDATTWNGDSTHAPSKDAVRDKIESLISGGSNWAANGSTNSTLAGEAAVNSIVSTNGITNQTLTASVVMGTDANKKEVSSTLTVTEANALHGITVLSGNMGAAGTYRSTTFDAQGRETSGTNPTTFSGYGVSDTSANLAAALTDETGSGAAVFATSPTLTTPVLGVATATSINGSTMPTSKTFVVTTDTLAVHAATTSSQLAGVLSDETGSGAAVFGTSPTIATPTITGATAVTGEITAPGIVLTNYARFKSVSLSYSSATNLTMDLNAGSVFYGTLTNTTFIAVPSNIPTDVQNIYLHLKQDGTGGRTVTFASNFKFQGGTAPTITSTASAQSMLSFTRDPFTTTNFISVSGLDFR